MFFYYVRLNTEINIWGKSHSDSFLSEIDFRVYFVMHVTTMFLDGIKSRAGGDRAK